MVYVETRTLDLRKRRGRAGAVSPVTLRRGEKGAAISVEITNGGEPFDMSGYAAYFCATTAAGERVRSAASVASSSPAVVQYTVGDDLTAASGAAMVAYVELTDGSVTMTTDTLPILVLDDAEI